MRGSCVDYARADVQTSRERRAADDQDSSEEGQRSAYQ
jgi:hypothetical protein